MIKLLRPSEDMVDINIEPKFQRGDVVHARHDSIFRVRNTWVNLDDDSAYYDLKKLDADDSDEVDEIRIPIAAAEEMDAKHRD